MPGRFSTLEDVTVVDFAVHIHPESLDIDPPEGAELVGRDRVCDPETQQRELAAAGVDAAVQSQPLFMSHDDVAATADANDELLALVEAYDEFYGLASIPTEAGGADAAAEFERCLDNGFHGGAVTTGRGRTLLSDPSLSPVFEVAQRTGAPIFVHVPRRSSSEFRTDLALRREFHLAESIYSVTHAGVFDRYPDLALVYHHYGGNIAGMMGHIHLQLDDGRWPRQDDLKPFSAFVDCLENNVYMDTAGHFGYSSPLRTALNHVPATQLLYGSDFPWEPRTEAELRQFTETVVDATGRADARRILGDNALDVLVNVG